MKKNKLISIVIPVYNAAKYLEKCLDSIINQTYNNIEIIIINDGSKDESKDICKKYEEQYNNIIFIDQINQGVSSARNAGIKKANGEYIMFVDSDDYIDDNMVSVLYQSLIDNESELVICNVYGNSSFEKLPKIINREIALDYILDKDKFRGYPVNKLYQTSYVKDILFNKEVKICEDLLFNCEYISKINKISIINDYLYHYNRNDNSAITNNKNLNKKTSLTAYEKMIPIYEKYNPRAIMKLYTCIIKTYSDVLFNYHCAKIRFDDANKINFVTQIYSEFMKCKSNSLQKKFEILIYYKFPILIQNLRRLYYKINTNKR